MENKIENNKEKKKWDKKSIIKEIRDYVFLIVLAFALAFLMNKFVYANAYRFYDSYSSAGRQADSKQISVSV